MTTNAQPDPTEPAPENETQAATTPEEAIANIIAGMEQEITTLKDQVLRAAAEVENTRKRAQRDQEETAKYSVTGFARDLVSVAENLQRAAESIPAEARADNPLLKTLAEGVDLTLRELLNIFERNGIRRVHPLGEKFDHNTHQAVAQIETPDTAPGMVVQVLQAGYVIHDRLLRPAMVAVSKQGETPKAVDQTA